MRETIEDLRALRELLDASIERAGPFLRSSFEMPEHSLSAAQLANHLQGIVTVALATTAATGAPRVAPIGAILVHGRFYIPTVGSAARTRHLQRRPDLSITYYEGIDLAVIIHGGASLIRPGRTDFELVDAVYRELAGESVLDWDAPDGLYIRVDPDVIFTFARYPDEFPG